MKKASKRKAREWWVIVQKSGLLCAYYDPSFKKSLVQNDLRFEKKGENDLSGFYKGAKVIKVCEILPKRKGVR